MLQKRWDYPRPSRNVAFRARRAPQAGSRALCGCIWTRRALLPALGPGQQPCSHGPPRLTAAPPPRPSFPSQVFLQELQERVQVDAKTLKWVQGQGQGQERQVASSEIVRPPCQWPQSDPSQRCAAIGQETAALVASYAPGLAHCAHPAC